MRRRSLASLIAALSTGLLLAPVAQAGAPAGGFRLGGPTGGRTAGMPDPE